MTARLHYLAGLLAALAVIAAGTVDAQIVDVRQGTNLSVAYEPGREILVVDLLGGLWRLPVTGGGATALIPAGSGIAQPRFDPAGERVVVQRLLEGQWDIWMLELSSGLWSSVTETSHNEREPEFTRDGRAIVFASDRNGSYDLWQLDLDSGALRQLTDEPGDNSFPSVSGAGTIVYGHRGPDGSALRVYAGSPRGRDLISSEAALSAPSWRPGIDVLVFNDRIAAERSDLRLLIDADLPVTRSLTRGEDVFVGRAAWLSAEEYVYAADGQLWRRKIASTERRPVHLFAGVAVEQQRPATATIPLDAPGPHRVHGIRDIALETDGRRIAFAALGDLWLLDGRTLERLTDDSFVDVAPSFTADGRGLVHISDRAGKLDLWTLDLENRVQRQLTNENDPISAAVLDGDTAYFLAGDTQGGRIPAEIGRLRIDEPYRTEIVTDGLYDARDFRIDGSSLRVRARPDRPDAALQDIVVVNPLASAAPSPGDAPIPDAIAAAELSWTPVGAESDYVVQAGRVFDGIRNEYSRHMDIHVSGQRITAIVGRGRLPLPERVIDAREKTVLPGFIDVHAHHRRTHGERLGRLWLAFGVTTVREADAPGRAAIERAESWASGRRPGPRLVMSADLSGITGGAVPTPATLSAPAGISEGFAHALARRDSYIERVRGQGPSAEETPLLTLSPLNLSYQDSIARVVGSGTFMVTALAAIRAPGLASRRPQAGAATLAELYTPVDRRRGAPSPVREPISLGPFADTLGRLQRSSGRIAIGSDAPAVPYGYGLHLELALLAESGVPNAQVLRWATAAGAMALGLDQQLGTLEPGKLADFVIVDGDPLEEIGDTQRIDAVAKGGVVFTREQLLKVPTG